MRNMYLNVNLGANDDEDVDKSGLLIVWNDISMSGTVGV